MGQNLSGVSAGSTSATTTADMGADGLTGGQNINIARDIVGYSLNYFTGDYTPINNNYTPSSAYLGTAYKPLYNLINLCKNLIKACPQWQAFILGSCR